MKYKLILLLFFLNACKKHREPLAGRWQLTHSKMQPSESSGGYEYDPGTDTNKYFKTFLNDSIVLLQDNFKNAKLLRYNLKGDTMIVDGIKYVFSINDEEMVLQNVIKGNVYHHKKIKYH